MTVPPTRSTLSNVSWEVEPNLAPLRAIAHPLRLRMLSLLTGTEMSAAEVARELGITHANASYHLRQLHAAGLLDVAGEERVRGGLARRYRHAPVALDRGSRTPGTQRLAYQALADELGRRSTAVGEGPQTLTDAELWVDPAVWASVCDRVADAMRDLHHAARPPRSSGAVRTSATVALFTMAADQ